MMISHKYSKPTIPFLNFFSSILNLFVFSKDRFVAQPVSLSLEPQSKTSCPIEDCCLCQEICPAKIIVKEKQSVTLASIGCFECELCVERCPEHLIKKK